MTSQNNNPYVAPQAELSNLPASEKPEIDDWLWLYIANCIVPGFFGLLVTPYAYGHTAMLCGVIVMYFASCKFFTWYPKKFQSVKEGAIILAFLQFIPPFIHVLIGLICFDIVRAFEHLLPVAMLSRADKSNGPYFYLESWPGALLLTLLVGMVLFVVAYILGLIFGKPAHVKQATNEYVTIHYSTNTHPPHNSTESS